MNKRRWDSVLYGIAEDQAGSFTAAQARAAGLHQVRLVQLAQQGDIERVSHGVYRFARFPVSRSRPLEKDIIGPDRSTHGFELGANSTRGARIVFVEESPL